MNKGFTLLELIAVMVLILIVVWIIIIFMIVGNNNNNIDCRFTSKGIICDYGRIGD